MDVMIEVVVVMAAVVVVVTTGGLGGSISKNTHTFMWGLLCVQGDEVVCRSVSKWFQLLNLSAQPKPTSKSFRYNLHQGVTMKQTLTTKRGGVL